MAHNIPEDLKYTKEHEWIKFEDNKAIIGITDFAQSSLGDIVFIDLPEVGKKLEKDGAFGVVESIKSVSDLYSPLEGEVIAINEALNDTPDLCNSDPYGAWMIRIKCIQPEQMSNLLDPSQYTDHCKD